MFTVLDPQGNLTEGMVPSLSEEQLISAYRLILLSREVDRRLVALNRLGRLGTYPPVEGQEAAAIGSALALDRSRDWIVPAYRELPALIVHGMPLSNLLATYFGKLNFARIPDAVHLLPRQQSVGAQLPHAVGLAWGLKIRRTGGVVLVYLGEGASSKGDFHEACNLAGVLSAPVIFVLQNNGWAISTPSARQTAAKSIAERASGYGFDGLVVDGNDLLAVHKVTLQAVERARSGGGPTLIEACTYRLSMHNTSDNPNAYRQDSEVEAARSVEPLSRLHKYLIRVGALNDARVSALKSELSVELDAALSEVARQPSPVPDDLFHNVYDVLPTRLEAQLATLAWSQAKPGRNG